jgi:membrane dipeptidase
MGEEASEIIEAADCIELHLESFIWTRMFGYEIGRRHGRGLLGGRLLSQSDVPRLEDSGLTGSFWSIATNPYIPRKRRTEVLVDNLRRLRSLLQEQPGLEVVRSAEDYERARSANRHACWLAVQGANALSRVEDVSRIRRHVSRVTLVHMTDSHVGATSNLLGWRGGGGLTEFGRDLVRALDRARILVDLAHASERTFWDAMKVHEPSIPVIVSHTGVRGVHATFRNITDEQVRAVADTGGVVGIMAHAWALAPPWRRATTDTMVDHMEHVIEVAGDEHLALGNDWDGFILTPPDMRTVDRLPALVERMLDRGFTPGRVRRILGENALRVLSAL